MNLLQLNLFRGGIFKQIKFLFSSPLQSQNAYYIAESGTASREILPIHTGFAKPLQDKKAWQVIHNLKLRVLKEGVPVQDETVLLISDRSHLPLDPLNILKQKEKERFASLTDIAQLRHAEARSEYVRGYDKTTDIPQLVIVGSFIIMGLSLLMALIKGC